MVKNHKRSCLFDFFADTFKNVLFCLNLGKCFFENTKIVKFCQYYLNFGGEVWRQQYYAIPEVDVSYKLHCVLLLRRQMFKRSGPICPHLFSEQGVSKLFSKFFIKTTWSYSKNFALSEPSIKRRLETLLSCYSLPFKLKNFRLSAFILY